MADIDTPQEGEPFFPEDFDITGMPEKDRPFDAAKYGEITFCWGLVTGVYPPITQLRSYFHFVALLYNMQEEMRKLGWWAYQNNLNTWKVKREHQVKLVLKQHALCAVTLYRLMSRDHTTPWDKLDWKKLAGPYA